MAKDKKPKELLPKTIAGAKLLTSDHSTPRMAAPLRLVRKWPRCPA